MIITLQETNTKPENFEFLKQLWHYDSHWTTKTAILTSNKNIKFTNILSTNDRNITVDFTLNGLTYSLETVYAPPNLQARRDFLLNWTPRTTQHIQILTGDFNTSTDPHNNRYSTAPLQPDPTRQILLDKTSHLIDMQDITETKTLHTFFQTTSNNRCMANKIDYIFLDPDIAQFCTRLWTAETLSDHTALIAEISPNQSEQPINPMNWKLNKILLNIPDLNEQINQTLLKEEDWDTTKMIIQSICRHHAKRKPSLNRRIKTLQLRINKLRTRLLYTPEAQDLQTLLTIAETDLQKEFNELANKWRIRSKTR